MRLTKIDAPLLRRDDSVGTRIFAGDTMVYGDTGVRALTLWDSAGVITTGQMPECLTPLPGYSGGIWISRTGTVIDMLIGGASVVSTGSISIPDGFRAQSPYPAIPIIIGDSVKTVNVGSSALFISSGLIGMQFFSTTDAYKGSLSWRTRRPWPPILPGLPA